VVTPDNPLALASIGDVVAKHARLALRPQGAGAQLLLLALLHRAKASLEKLAPGPTCPTGTDIAQVIRSGHADCGIATRSVANAAGLGFVPILWENFDLVMRQCDYFRPPLQALFGFIRTGGLLARALDAGGYDVSVAGKVRYAP
jgi:molybdate-binding protein